MKRLLAFAVALFVSATANAQTAVQQTGPVSENGAVMWSTDHKIRQAAGALGDVAGKMITGGLSAVGNVCAFSDTTNNAYAALCLNPNGSLTFNGSAYPLTGGGGNVSGPTPTTIGELVSWNSAAGVLLRQGAASLTDNKTGGVIADGAALGVSQNSGTTARDIYQMTTTVAVSMYDAVRGVAVATPGTTTTGVTGVAGYAIGRTPQGLGGTSANPVALFGVGVAATDGGWAWGINTLLTDTTVPGVVSSGAGRQLWNELDFNVTSPNTRVQGLILTGASIATPALGVGVTVAPLGAGHPWTAAYISMDGAATTGMALGAQSATASAPSQLLQLGWYTSGGIQANHSFQSANGNLTLDSSQIAGTGNLTLAKGGLITTDGGSPTAFAVGATASSGPSLSSQSVLFKWVNAASAPFVVGLQAASDGKLNVLTNGGATTGSLNLPAGAGYYINGVQGVSCTGTPTALFASVGGMVTHC